MAVALNSAGKSKANSLISSGNVDKASAWSFSADDGNKILGDPPDWSAYSKWFLGVDASADKKTKEHYKYPFGKNGKVYRSALTAIRQRAGQQGADDIFSAAGILIDKIDANNKKSDQSLIEIRNFDFKIDTNEKNDNQKILIGHAAVFGEYTDMGWFQERILPGAFTEAILNDDVRALFNHDPNYVIGRNKSGTLSLSEDAQGLAIEIIPPDTQFAKDLMVLISRGDISQMSFAFQVLEEKWTNFVENSRQDKRDLIKVSLYDVSPVTYPAYPTTDVALKSFRSWKASQIEPDLSWKTSLKRKRLDLQLKGR
jgi:HK97 family phage prohead protease